MLGALVTEGLGEVFPDGHFNRSLESDRVGNEYQMGLAAVTPDEFSAWTRTMLANHLSARWRSYSALASPVKHAP